MPCHDAIHVEGIVVEVLRGGLFRAELSNGHRVLAHPTRHSRGQLDSVGVGSKVRLELSPFDMSTARIVADAPAADVGPG